ncbi:MAG: ATP-binding protein [Opitutaceae bacterium]|nr:ATP-binding protein [Opitutaceae bacterium]
MTTKRSPTLKPIRRGLFSLLLGAVAHSVFAAQPYVPKVTDPLLDSSHWQKIAELDGKNPQCLVEGKDGAVWFGVSHGLMRYDGMKWASHGAKEGAVDSPVTALLSSKAGHILAASELGVMKFDGAAWTQLFRTPVGYPLQFHTLFEAADGALWAATDKCVVKISVDGTVIFAESQFTPGVAAAYPALPVITLPRTRPTDEPPDRQGRAVYQTSDGTIWLGLCYGEVIRIDPKKNALTDSTAFHQLTSAEGFQPGGGVTFHETRDGRLWIGNMLSQVGMNQYDPATGRCTYFSFSELFGSDDIVASLIGTADGSVWAGGLAKIFRYHDGEWRIYRATDVPLSASRNVLMESRDGYLWVLGLRDGVQKIDYRGRRWTRFEGLNYQCETADGSQWFISSDNSVVRHDGKSWLRYGTEDGLIGAPNALITSRRGLLWAAGSHEGKAATACLEGDRWSLKLHDRDSPPFGSALDYRAVFESADGSMWFACYINAGLGGQLQYDPARGPPHDDRAWRTHQKLPDFRTSHGFAQLADGRLFSASAHGMMEYDGQQWQPFPVPGARQFDAVAHSPDGTSLWIAARGQGLLRYDGKNFTKFDVKDGLSANGVTALLCEDNERVWAATSKGISHFDGREWTQQVFGEGSMTMGSESGNLKRSPDGSLWINRLSREWLRRVLPGARMTDSITKDFWCVRYQPERAPPKTEFTLALPRVSQPGNTVVSWRGISPWWHSPERSLRYSYRLDGGPWSRFDPATSHVFLELPPGQRLIEVRAQDRDLNIEAVPARLAFEVLPPVWQEPWFIGVIALLVGAIATQTVRVVRHSRRLRHNNRQLEANSRQLLDQKTQLEGEITQRKKMEAEVALAHQRLLEASRQAGMAEVAVNVLHNVGNALNSVNVSASLIAGTVQKSKAEQFSKVTAMMREHEADLADFLKHDPKGKFVPGFLQTLAQTALKEREQLLTEIGVLQQHVGQITEIVAKQQTHAAAGPMLEPLAPATLIEESLRDIAGKAPRNQPALVERQFTPVPTVLGVRSKTTQILSTLVSNAHHACDETGRNDKRVTLRVEPGRPGYVRLSVQDNGVGIQPENLTKIFAQGFTRRNGGGGFGLHAAANAATEMKSTLTAHSRGYGHGATFTLEMPIAPE